MRHEGVLSCTLVSRATTAGLHQHRGAGGRGGKGQDNFQPAPPPLARAPGRGGARLPDVGEAATGAIESKEPWSKTRVRTPLAGRPGPLCAAPPGDRRVRCPTWRAYSTSAKMHSARFDSFLSQLRWELVSLWSGCGCEDVCGVRGCRLAGATNGNGVDSGCPSESGWGQGSALQMAQMARFGFLTVGNCSGHQVSGAQLAVLVAGVGGRRVGERSFFWGDR